MACQFRRMEPGQTGNREAAHHRARQALGNNTQTAVLFLRVPERRNTRQDTTGVGAEEVLWCHLILAVEPLHEEEVHGARFDVPDALRIAEVQRLIARQLLQRVVTGSEAGERYGLCLCCGVVLFHGLNLP